MRALDDPLAASRVIETLRAGLVARGLIVEFSDDFERFDRLKRECRDGQLSAPMFDPAVANVDGELAFWLALHDAAGTTCAIQAFRTDFVEPNLADWALGWVLGVYLKREELLIPQQLNVAPHSIAKTLSGRIVYHGELWLDRSMRGHGVMEDFAKLGIFLSLVKWQPEAIWCLCSNRLATNGTMTRMGYAHLERGFFNWSFLPDGADEVEWLAAATKNSLELMIQNMAQQ